jgi:hypothetical protein
MHAIRKKLWHTGGLSFTCYSMFDTIYGFKPSLIIHRHENVNKLQRNIFESKVGLQILKYIQDYLKLVRINLVCKLLLDTMIPQLK